MYPSLESININYWVLQTIAMAVTALLIPKLRITSPFGALGAVVALAFVNAHVWDAALFFAIPDHFTTHALTLVVANGVIFWLIVKILPGIETDGVLPSLVAPLVFTAVSLGLSQYAKDIDWVALGKRGLSQVQSYRNDMVDEHSADAPAKKGDTSAAH